MTSADPQKPGKENRTGDVRSIAALATWALLILILSVSPLPQVAPPKFIFLSFDTFAHACFYVPLGALFFWSIPMKNRWSRLLLATFSAVLYGILIELVQAMLPWRSCELTDAIADLIGGALGAGFALAFPRIHASSLLSFLRR